MHKYVCTLGNLIDINFIRLERDKLQSEPANNLIDSSEQD